MVYCPGKLTRISDYHALYRECKEKTNLDHSIKKNIFFLNSMLLNSQMFYKSNKHHFLCVKQRN